MTTPAAGDGHDHDVLTVAVAMLRYGLPGTGAEGVRLEASRDDNGTWLRLIFPVGKAEAPRQCSGDAGELMQIDAIADRWGHRGGTELPSTLWAILH